MPLQRIANIDRLRILAVIGIVWFHTEGAPGSRIAYAGLPVFLLICFSLVVKRSHIGTTKRFLRRRWDRLLKPWLFWSAMYGLCKLAYTVCTGSLGSLSELVSVETLFIGTNIHLWYLPYAFVSGLIVYQCNRWTSRTNNIVIVFVATIIGILTLIGYALARCHYRLPEPLPQWEFGLSAMPLGFAVGRCLVLPSHHVQRSLLLMICLTTVASCVVLNGLGYASPAIPYGLAVSLVCLAYSRQGRSDAFVEAVVPLTFGIYLIYPLVAFVLRRLPLANLHFTLFIALTVCISGLMTVALIKTPARRFV